MRRNLVLALVLVLTFWTGTSALAGPILYTSLGPGNTWDSTFSSTSGASSYSHAIRFQVTTSGVLAELIGAWGGEPQNSYSVDLRADDGSGQPGVSFESWVLPISQTTPSLFQLTSVAQPVLNVGDFYWVLFNSSGANSLDMRWGFSSSGPLGGLWVAGASQPFANIFEEYAKPGVTLVGASSVPDPGSSLLLLGMGLVGLRAWRKRWQ